MHTYVSALMVHAGHPVLNVISLEITGSPLAEQVVAPQFARDMDWIDSAWPASLKRVRVANGDSIRFPQVEFMCVCVCV